jgi:periplasmic divalent cation tolerance protein
MKLLYATFASKDEALSIAEALLEEKLIACANIIDGAVSVYRWEGKAQKQPEAMLFAKTSEAALQRAIARIKELSSYELPCILALPVEEGLTPFIKWVEVETT